MHVELVTTQQKFLELYKQQRAALERQPTVVLVDLEQESHALTDDPTFSIRAAAEINVAACVSILRTR
jgi:hypothetical protein